MLLPAPTYTVSSVGVSDERAGEEKIGQGLEASTGSIRSKVHFEEPHE